MHWGFGSKNIMTLILKTLIWDYYWGKEKPIYTYVDRASGISLAAECRFISCDNYADTYMKGKTLNGRRECMFRGKVKKTLITFCEAIITLLTLIVSRETSSVHLKNEGSPLKFYGLHSILTSQCNMAKNLSVKKWLRKMVVGSWFKLKMCLLTLV